MTWGCCQRSLFRLSSGPGRSKLSNCYGRQQGDTEPAVSSRDGHQDPGRHCPANGPCEDGMIICLILIKINSVNNNTCITVFFLHVFLNFCFRFWMLLSGMIWWMLSYSTSKMSWYLIIRRDWHLLAKGHQSWKPDLSWLKLLRTFSECATCEYVISSKPKFFQKVQALYGKNIT